jgi:hypothetical protein
MLPAGPSPLVLAVMSAPLDKLTDCAAIVIFAGTLDEVPPAIVVLMVLLSRFTLVAELPGPLTP